MNKWKIEHPKNQEDKNVLKKKKLEREKNENRIIKTKNESTIKKKHKT